MHFLAPRCNCQDQKTDFWHHVHFSEHVEISHEGEVYIQYNILYLEKWNLLICPFLKKLCSGDYVLRNHNKTDNHLAYNFLFYFLFIRCFIMAIATNVMLLFLFVWIIFLSDFCRLVQVFYSMKMFTSLILPTSPEPALVTHDTCDKSHPSPQLQIEFCNPQHTITNINNIEVFLMWCLR